MQTIVIDYSDGSPSETYTNCSPPQSHDGVVEFHGTIGGVTDDWIIPLWRVARIH